LVQIALSFPEYCAMVPLQIDPRHRKRRPVIHLASAVHGFLHLAGPTTDFMSFVPLMTDRKILEYVIWNAQHCGALFARKDAPGDWLPIVEGLFSDHYAYTISKAARSVNRSDAHDRQAQ
jgi:hypothetical protein